MQLHLRSSPLSQRVTAAKLRLAAFPTAGTRNLACRSAVHEPPSSTGGMTQSASKHDFYMMAGLRLQALLSGVGNGEDELIQNLVAEESPESKLQTSIVFGAGLTTGAIIVSTLLGQDPWGGASFSVHSLQAAAIGAAAAIPLVAFRAWSWTPAAAHVLPSLEDMHSGQLEFQRAWLTSMSQKQAVLMMALEVLPLTLLIFPAAQGGIAALLGLYSKVLQAFSLSTSPEQLNTIALFAVAILSGAGRGVELAGSKEEYDLVQTAAVNADRYYRTMASANLHSLEEAAQAANAFRLVSQAWIQTKEGASATAGILTILDVLLLGTLWHATGDLTSTAVAALAINYVDICNMHQAVVRREDRLKTAGGPPRSGPPSRPGSGRSSSEQQ